MRPIVILVSLFAMMLVAGRASAADGTEHPKVVITEGRTTYTLSNGIVSADVHKRTGDLLSLKFKGQELLGRGSGHPFGYWSHSPGNGMRTTNSITINPARNEGERAEVSIKGYFTGNTNAQRAGPGGTTACDIEIRYALGQGDSGLYTYSIFTHQKDYPATGIGEARFGTKLNPEVFDYMTIDARRRKVMPKPEDWDKGTEMNFKEARRLNTGLYKGQVEHKYDYSAIQFDIPAFGWSSTQHRIGIWFVNPTIEYLSGGATKVELTGHLDNNEGGDPTLLNYWRGSHYGGSICAIAENENWSKVIGPFLIYCNSAPDHEKMWHDALSRAEAESNAWPYYWVQGVDYPKGNERGAIQGQVVVADPQSPKLKPGNVLIGLAPPKYVAPQVGQRGGGNFSFGGGGEDEAGTNASRSAEGLARPETFEPGNTNQPAGRGSNRGNRSRGPDGPHIVEWQNDAKFYQFWVRADQQGRFVIPKVRPGRYSLHVIADGVLGEAVMTNISISAGQVLDVGRLQWTPARYGRQLWEIGIPNRSAEEFLHGDHYFQWGLYYQYTNDFPNDVNFVIGKSDFRKDWNYAQVPRGTNAGTTWSITFDLPKAPKGRATLRMGLAGVSVRGGIQLTMNDAPAGGTGPLQDTATIRRDGIRGFWSERNVVFDARLMRAGKNVLKLTIPRGSPTSGVEYDYLRLELDDTQPIADSRR